MHADLSKPEMIEQDPDAILRLLDLELRQKRAIWQRASARHRTSRIVWFFSIFVVIAGALLALLFVFSKANEEKANSRHPTTLNSLDH
jgi:hypothetical protein